MDVIWFNPTKKEYNEFKSPVNEITNLLQLKEVF